ARLPTSAASTRSAAARPRRTVASVSWSPRSSPATQCRRTWSRSSTSSVTVSSRRPMTAVDVHQHLWPAPFVDALSRRSAPPRLDGSTLVLVEGSYQIDLAAHDAEAPAAALDRDAIDI